MITEKYMFVVGMNDSPTSKLCLGGSKQYLFFVLFLCFLHCERCFGASRSRGQKARQSEVVVKNASSPVSQSCIVVKNDGSEDFFFPAVLSLVPLLSEAHLHVGAIEHLCRAFSTVVQQHLPKQLLLGGVPHCHGGGHSHGAGSPAPRLLAFAHARPSPPGEDAATARREFLGAAAAAALVGSGARPARAEAAAAGGGAESDRLRADYDGFAKDYNQLDGGAAARALGLPQLRREVMAGVAGDVLEVAVGTGLNLPNYDPSKATVISAFMTTIVLIARLTAVDLSPGMLAEARTALARLPDGGLLAAKTDLREMDATALQFEDARFDAVVDTFSLCVFPDPARALREMRRVVRPGGRVVLLENNRPDNPLLGAYFDATADAVAGLGGKGCRYNQDVAALARAAGLEVVARRGLQGGVFVYVEARRPPL